MTNTVIVVILTCISVNLGLVAFVLRRIANALESMAEKKGE